jgi:hypothetical protein
MDACWPGQQTGLLGIVQTLGIPKGPARQAFE